MRTLLRSIVMSLGLALLVVGSSRGQATVNHAAFPGTEHDITDISGFMTTGEDMGGMRVTAYFDAALSTSETVFWLPGLSGSEAGSATGTMGWRIDEVGDTWNNKWVVSPDGVSATNLSLYGLLLEGFLPSDDPVSVRATVFDRTSPFFGTDGSYRGNDLDVLSSAGNWSHVRVSYIDEVDNLADPKPGPQKDVYRAMRIQFGEITPANLFNPIPFDFNDELVFLQDTDTVGERIPGDPGEEGMPEPSSVILLAIGLAIAGLKRSRQ